MVQGVDSARLCEAIVDVFLRIERVHKNKVGLFVLFEKFLFETTRILSIVNDHLAVARRSKPLIVRFEETHVERVKGGA